MWGADAGQLLALAARLDRQANDLDRAQQALTGRLRSAPWQGPGADRYRQLWESHDRRQVMAAAGFLRDSARELRVNAAQQQEASQRSDASNAVDLALSAFSKFFGRGRDPLATSALSKLFSGGRDPASVRQAWSTLSRAEQEALIRAYPETIGKTDGLPGWARDEANRAVIKDELERLKRELEDVERSLDGKLPGWIPDSKLKNVLEGALTNEDRKAQIIRGKIDALGLLHAYGSDRQILLADASGERVKAAVAVGNIDQADNIAVTVHGFNSSVEGEMAGYVTNAARLQQMAEGLDPASDTAVVVWMGYEAPQSKDTLGSGSVALSGTAERAAPQLNSFLTGIDADRQDGVRLVVIGHSYGSLVTGLSMEGGNHSVDAVIFQGSPGIGVGDVHDLGVPEGQVYVAEADWDVIADAARFSEDPNLMEGVRVLETDAVGEHKGSTWHSAYFKEDSTSLYNSAGVVTGTDGVILDPTRNVDAGDVIGDATQKPRLW